MKKKSFNKKSPLVMYLLHIADVDKKLFTCSTSSLAPSWFQPPHLILCTHCIFIWIT